MFLHYLGKNALSDFHVFNNRYWFYFHKTSFVLDLNAARQRECPWMTIRALALTVLLKLTSYVSVSDIILL